MTAIVVFVVIKRRERKLFDIVITRVVQADAIDNTNYMGFDTVHMVGHHEYNVIQIETWAEPAFEPVINYGNIQA